MAADTMPQEVKPRDLQDFIEVLIDVAPEGQIPEKESPNKNNTPEKEASEADGPASDSTNSQEQEEEKVQSTSELWGESWSEMISRLRASSPFGHLNSWSALPLLVKGNDDLR